MKSLYEVKNKQDAYLTDEKCVNLYQVSHVKPSKYNVCKEKLTTVSHQQEEHLLVNITIYYTCQYNRKLVSFSRLAVYAYSLPLLKHSCSLQHPLFCQIDKTINEKDKHDSIHQLIRHNTNKFYHFL